MNSIQPPYDVHQSHMAQQHSSGPPSGIGHYSHYSQAPLLQPASHPYYSAPSGYQYQYTGAMNPASAHPVSSSMGNQMIQPLPGMAAATSALSGSQGYHHPTPDTTGQVAPPGVKPRVTATLWEDEGSLCFQVEAKGVCVARREDNHFINGTKLLNVAGMTRGRRDGILKSEKVRHVVKIGPMHLKGVWIPFERALDFANKEKITEFLYPLFVHGIGDLLYHGPQGEGGKAGTMATVDRNRMGPRYLTTSQTAQSPSLHHHHTLSHPMNSAASPHALQHPGAGRPSMDRAHTFPTPPTSASSMPLGAQYPPNEWSASGVSVPSTPATTPPGNAVGGMQPFPTTQGYDASRSVYTAPSAQLSPFTQTLRYHQPSFKTDMAPPSRAGDENDVKHDIMGQAATQTLHVDDEHDQGEYTHTTAPYVARTDPYNFGQGSAAALHSSPEVVSSSPQQLNGSGRATPRTSTNFPFGGPQRASSTSNLYSVMGETHTPANGAAEAAYAPTGFNSQYSNGSTAIKRGRDDEDDFVRPESRSEITDLKRRKTAPINGPVGSPYDKAAKAAR